MQKFAVAALAVVVSALALVNPGSATAATGAGTIWYNTSRCSTANGTGSVAVVNFVAKAGSHGPRNMSVFDNCRDGHSAVGQWKLGGASSTRTVKTVWNPYGYRNRYVNVDPGSTGLTKVSFRACSGDYGPRRIIACTAWKTIS